MARPCAAAFSTLARRTLRIVAREKGVGSLFCYRKKTPDPFSPFPFLLSALLLVDMPTWGQACHLGALGAALWASATYIAAKVVAATAAMSEGNAAAAPKQKHRNANQENRNPKRNDNSQVRSARARMPNFNTRKRVE